LTDNKNRTTSDVRAIFTKRGGNMAGAGSVAFQFDKKGVFMVKKEDANEDELLDIALEAGAEDLTSDEDFYQITCAPQDFDKVRKGLTKKNVPIKSGELSMVPKNTVKISDAETAKKVLALVEDLEDNDDVQNVYSNFDIPDEILKTIEPE
ncbi:MAG: YebC/PmpR family DNA-binding transcriptional regulator, partial [Candidatus Omnitrophica bacterium]|nr:YebC/PmpR family DNA-binding transcriptional regulator [Candidatus Omnitrophota bacterium]